MKKLTFDRLLGLGIVLVVLANVLAFLFHAGILVNLAWLVYGVLCLFHPVCPARWQGSAREKSALLGVRIAGGICMAIGLLTRFIV